jgi:hypothetical protein
MAVNMNNWYSGFYRHVVPRKLNVSEEFLYSHSVLKSKASKKAELKSKASKKAEAGGSHSFPPTSCGFILGLLFSPEDGDTFI